MAAAMTCEELQNLLATVTAGVAGGTETLWRTKIGPVKKLPSVYHLRSNWAVTPMCGTDDHRIISHAVELVRSEHPYVAG